jgi:hypothetical protein
MHDLSVQAPYCDPHVEDNCGLPFVASLYFSSFVVVTTLTMLKLLIAVIIENFSDTVALDAEKEVRRASVVTCLAGDSTDES